MTDRSDRPFDPVALHQEGFNVGEQDNADQPIEPPKDRGEFVASRIRQWLENLTEDAIYWTDTPPAGLEVEPLWVELRDAIVSVLFDMDREQAEGERLAREVADKCL